MLEDVILLVGGSVLACPSPCVRIMSDDKTCKAVEALLYNVCLNVTYFDQ
jgi:hypothetical protein